MSQSSARDFVFYLLLLILPLSALAARRLLIGSILKMATGWVAIFAVLLILVGQRERFRSLWMNAQTTLTGADRIVTGGTVRIPINDDGHFWAIATINGVTRRMLIDSGATTTALTVETARAAGVAPDSYAPSVGLDTANGHIVAQRATVAAFQLGEISAVGLPVVVASEFGETNVIGMNFLSRLRGWRVDGRTLILNPDTP